MKACRPALVAEYTGEIGNGTNASPDVTFTKVYPVVPPRVEYALTDLGTALSAAFCGVWVWAAENLFKVEAARNAFDRLAMGGGVTGLPSPAKARANKRG